MGDLRDWDVMDSDGSVRMHMRLFHGADLHLSSFDSKLRVFLIARREIWGLERIRLHRRSIMEF